MATFIAVTTFLLSFFLSMLQLSNCNLLQGAVSCVDCIDHDLSGVRVGVKCGPEKLYATTDEDGHFITELPTSTSSDCFTMLLGGTKQFCAPRKALIAKVVKEDANSFTIETPLTFSSNCRAAKGLFPGVKSSKTIDLPLPKEWGLAPTSYYFPFFPIIGIP